MNKYYYIENDNQFGPFTIKELKDKKITSKTLVWTEDLENWEEAKNIVELKDIFKKVPPPIPNKIKKPLKIEAEIIKKKEKILTPEREIKIAKETKLNFKFITYSILIGVMTFLYFVYENKGFEHKSIESKLKDDMYKSEYNYEGKERNEFLQNRENLKNESFSLGYRGYSEYYFSTDSALKYHNDEFVKSLKESIVPSLLAVLISSLVLIFGRYLIKGAKWVEEKSNN